MIEHNFNLNDFFLYTACVNVLVVGGGALGLWTLKLSQYLMGRDCSNVRVMVADNNIERLMVAQDHGCSDIIFWNEEDHEQYIVERTLDACRGGVDVIIDFVGSHRTMQRSLKVLNRVSISLKLAFILPLSCCERIVGILFI